MVNSVDEKVDRLRKAQRALLERHIRIGADESLALLNDIERLTTENEKLNMQVMHAENEGYDAAIKEIEARHGDIQIGKESREKVNALGSRDMRDIRYLLAEVKRLTAENKVLKAIAICAQVVAENNSLEEMDGMPVVGMSALQVALKDWDSGRRAPIEEVGEDGFPPAQIAPPPPDNSDDSPPRSIIGKRYGNLYKHVFVKTKRSGIYECCCGVRRKKGRSISKASSDDLSPFVYQKWNTRKWSDTEPPCTGPRINENRVDGRQEQNDDT